MKTLVFGLILFLGAHSVRIFADRWRSSMVVKLGDGAWKTLYSIISIIGFILIVKGYSNARLENIQVWSPPMWSWQITAALNLIAFILLSAAYIPKNAFKDKLKDPMILGVKTWAFAHLISNGSLSGILLFGSFLIWAIMDFRSCRIRRSNAKDSVVGSSIAMTLITLVVGLTSWLGFALYGHQALFGINPIA